MPTDTRVISLSNQGLNIKVSSALYTSAKFEDDMPLVSTLLDLGESVTEGLQVLFSETRDCSHLASTLTTAVEKYATGLKDLNSTRSSPSITSDSWDRLAPFVSAKIRFKKEIRTHFALLSDIILNDEALDISQAFEADVQLLTDVATEVISVIDTIFALDGKPCQECKKHDDVDRLAPLKLVESMTKSLSLESVQDQSPASEASSPFEDLKQPSHFGIRTAPTSSNTPQTRNSPNPRPTVRRPSQLRQPRVHAGLSSRMKN